MFKSLRWKIALSYMLLILLSIIWLSFFVFRNLEHAYLEEKKVGLTNSANLLVDVSSGYYRAPYPQLPLIARSYGRKLGIRILFVDNSGQVLADSFGKMRGERLTNKEITQALKGQSVAQPHYYQEAGYVMYVAVPAMNRGQQVGVVFLSADINDIYTDLRSFRLKLYVLGAIVTVIAALFSTLLANRITTPIGKLTQVAKKISQGVYGQQVQVAGQDELAVLGRAFNEMSTRVAKEDQFRRDFISQASHELKSPLAGIKAMSEALLADNRATLSLYQEFMVDINAQIDRLTLLANNLLDLSQLEGAKTLELTETDLQYLAWEVVSALRYLAESKNIQVNVAGTKVLVLADRAKIYRALLNLVDNAIKFSLPGAKVEVKTGEDKNGALIQVADSGPGIPPDDLPYIFDRFYRVDKARSRELGGSGLGLAIVKQIILAHGGTVEVESQQGKGTTFTVALPKRPGES